MFFFVKRKTAYEMRMSDWSSDVCSSDLLRAVGNGRDPALPRRKDRAFPARRSGEARDLLAMADVPGIGRRPDVRTGSAFHALCQGPARICHRPLRSEEHTSELQSLMRISYAVFCSKKKQKRTTLKHKNRH